MAVFRNSPTALIFLIAFVGVVVPLSPAAACFSSCEFKFCSGRREFPTGATDSPFTGPICSKRGVPVGIVGSTGEAVVNENGINKRISKYNPTGLKQKFSPSFFKAYAITMKGKSGMSGIGHEVPQVNQAKFLKGLCVAVPIRAYQVLAEGRVVGNVHTHGSALRNCVAFTVALGAKELPVEKPAPSAEPFLEPQPSPVFALRTAKAESLGDAGVAESREPLPSAEEGDVSAEPTEEAEGKEHGKEGEKEKEEEQNEKDKENDENESSEEKDNDGDDDDN